MSGSSTEDNSPSYSSYSPPSHHTHKNNENNNNNKRSSAEMNFDEDVEETVLKKQKVPENDGKISKVLHCRNIPSDITEAELITLARPFGSVTNVLILKGKNQAFIQMQDEQSAHSLMQYYTSIQASLRGKLIYIQYSKRDEITLSEEPSQREQQSAILLVTILNVQYAITIDVLHRVFSKYGQILKIITFTKNRSFQSFVQYADISSAVAARHELENQNIYSGCCTLKIQFSQLSNLNVKFNNDKCRDFTNPNLPSGSDSQSQALFPDPVPYWSHPHPSHSYHPHAQQYNNNNIKNSMPNSCVLIASGIEKHMTPDNLFTLFGVYGDVVRVKILYNKKDTALLQFATPQQASIAMDNLDGLGFRGRLLKISYSKHQSISLPKANDNEEGEYTKDFTNSPLHRYKIVGSKNFQHITPPSPVLHVSNIPLTVNEEYLAEIFGQVGSVLNIKFFTKDRRMALVEFSNVEEAVEALIVMHDYTIDEQNIRVSFSKSALNTR